MVSHLLNDRIFWPKRNSPLGSKKWNNITVYLTVVPLCVCTAANFAAGSLKFSV